MEPTGLPPAAPLATRVEEAETLKALGNDQFGKKQYALAVTHYTDAVARLPPRAPDEGAAGDVGEAEDAAVAGEGAAVTLEEHLLFSTVAELRVKLYANLAASYLKLEHYEEAINASTEVLAEEPDNIKALHRRAIAHEKLGGWAHLQAALKDYQRLEALDKDGYVPTAFQPELRASLQRLPPLVDAEGEREKDAMVGKLKTLGNNVLGYFGLSTDNFQMNQQEGGGYSMNFVK